MLTPTDAPARLQSLAARVRRLAALVDGASVLPLRKVTEPRVPPLLMQGARLFAPVELTRRSSTPEGGKRYLSESPLYVGTPAVLRYLGIDPATVGAGSYFVADRGVRTDNLVMPSFTSRTEIAITNIQKVDIGHPLFGSDTAQSPPTFITPAGLRHYGWKSVPAGWLVESSRPLTNNQVADARDVAANAGPGLSIEVKRGKPTFAALMAIATGTGALLALAILAMTVGLIRSESSGDLRILTATGATPGSGAR